MAKNSSTQSKQNKTTAITKSHTLVVSSFFQVIFKLNLTH